MRYAWRLVFPSAPGLGAFAAAFTLTCCTPAQSPTDNGSSAPTASAHSGPSPATSAAGADAGTSAEGSPPTSVYAFCGAIHVRSKIFGPPARAAKVAAISTPVEPYDWTKIDVVGAGGALDQFELACGKTAPPFAVGDSISVVIDCSHGGWHRVCDGIVKDAAGVTLLILSSSGDAALAPGWTFKDGKQTDARRSTNVQETSIQHSYGLLATHEGKSVDTGAGWAALSASDGKWMVHGTSTRWEGVRPPEGVDYTTFAIVRLPGR